MLFPAACFGLAWHGRSDRPHCWALPRDQSLLLDRMRQIAGSRSIAVTRSQLIAPSQLNDVVGLIDRPVVVDSPRPC